MACSNDETVIVMKKGAEEPTELVEIYCEVSGTFGTAKLDHTGEGSAGNVLAELDMTRHETLVSVSRATYKKALAWNMLR